MIEKYEDLIEGKIYKQSNFIFKFGKRKNKTIGYDYYIQIPSYYFHLNKSTHNGSSYSSITNATNLEIEWLKSCIKACKLMPKPLKCKINEVWS